MLKTKKILSVVLAVLMLFSMLAFGSSALEAGKPFGIVLKANTNEIKQGDTITVTMYFEMADWNQLMSDMRLAILYDSNVYTPDLTSKQLLGDLAGYAKDSLSPNINAKFGDTVKSTSSMSAEEQASYNSAIMQQIGADAQLGQTAKAGFLVTEEADGLSVAQWSLDFEVTGDPNAGNKNIAVCDSVKANGQYIKQTTGSATPTLISGCDASKGNILANMEQPQPQGPVLTKASSQVKMTATSATTVADAFQFRVISSISAADWDAYFANTGKADATANAITSVGFVAYPGTEGFDLETAKSAVTDIGSAPGYYLATTDYIQHADGADAKFGCRIDITSAETRSDVTYVAFAQYLDASGAAQVVFYETSYEALLATNYTGIVAAYLNAFPFAG